MINFTKEFGSMYITIGHGEYHTKFCSFSTIALKIIFCCLFIMTNKRKKIFNQKRSSAKIYLSFLTGRQGLLLSLFQTNNYNFIFVVGGQKYLELKGMYSWNKINRFFLYRQGRFSMQMSISLLKSFSQSFMR